MGKSKASVLVLISFCIFFQIQVAVAHSFVTCGMISFTPRWNNLNPASDIQCIGYPRLFPNTSDRSEVPTYFPTTLDSKGNWTYNIDIRPGGALVYKVPKKKYPLIHPGQEEPVYYDNAPMSVAETGSTTMGIYRTNGHSIFNNTAFMNRTHEELAGFWAIYFSGKPGLSLRNITQLDQSKRVSFGGFSASTLLRERVIKVNNTGKLSIKGESGVGIFTIPLKDPVTKEDLIPGRYQFLYVWNWGYNVTVNDHWTTSFDIMVVPKGYKNGLFQAPKIPTNLTSYLYKSELDWASKKYNVVFNPNPDPITIVDNDQGAMVVPPPKTKIELQIAQRDNGTYFPNLTHSQPHDWKRPSYICSNGTVLPSLTSADLEDTRYETQMNLTLAPMRPSALNVATGLSFTITTPVPALSTAAVSYKMAKPSSSASFVNTSGDLQLGIKGVWIFLMAIIVLILA